MLQSAPAAVMLRPAASSNPNRSPRAATVPVSHDEPN